MKRIIINCLFVFIANITCLKAQTAMQLNGPDCNGNNHDLFADLDAGKAVLLHFFMDNCNSCIPPAQKTQAMANKIMSFHPGMITGYALPYTNSTTCTSTASWVSSNGLSLYMPYDSGATQVAHYGGFGMPTLVLLGGLNHRVMFSTQSFSASDTTIMRDSILALFNDAAGYTELTEQVQNFKVFPNPTSDIININLDLKTISKLTLEIIDLNGKRVAFISETKQKGLISKQFDVTNIPTGNYFIKAMIDGKTSSKPLTINH